MSRQKSKKRQVWVALALIAALLAPAWHTGQASAVARPAAVSEAADPAGMPANVPGASADWWAAVQQQIEQDTYAVRAGEAEGGALTYTAANRKHGFRVVFSAAGVRLVPAKGEEVWSWGLRLTAFGREGNTRPLAAPPKITGNGNQLEYKHAGLTEWYLNAERGLEQGFVIEAPPPGNAGGPALVLEMALETGLTPLLSEDGQSLDFLEEDGSAALLRYTDLAVVDAGGRELPAHLALAPGLISIWIDDTDAAYPLLVDPVVITPDWTVQGDQREGRLGTSVATAGDVNGDGYDDVLVGVPGYEVELSGDLREVGRAYLYYGSAGGLSTWPGWTAEGEHGALNLGAAVGTAGDVNADGYDDVAVGAPGDYRSTVRVYFGSGSGPAATPDWTDTNYGGNAGLGSAVGTAGDVNGDGFDDLVVSAIGLVRVLVYHGSATGLSDRAIWSAEGESQYGAFGSAVGTAGDVNGDGYDDLVIGDADFGNEEPVEGKASVYYGSADGLPGATSWTCEGNSTAAYLGDAVGTAGDLNGDGYDDLVVGAPGFTSGEDNEGRALVFYGSASGLPAAASWTAEGNQAERGLGDAVGTAGDMNGDGYDDLVVGAPGIWQGREDGGQVLVYYGSAAGLPDAAHWAAEGGQTWDLADGDEPPLFGAAVGTAGDVNGDGYDDVLVGAPGYNSAEDDVGRAYAFLGPVPVGTDYQWSAGGDAPGDELGRSAATAGDVNGDGYSDVVVGAPNNGENGADAGQVYVFHGGAAGLELLPWWITAGEGAAWRAAGEAVGDGFGSAVGTAGDLNGDGYGDLAVGAPGHGGGKVYVYYGSATGLGDAGWTANGQYGRDEFGSAVGAAGDLNRDGYDDLVVGASGYPDGGAYGKVYVYLGGVDGPGATPAWVASGPKAGERFGRAVAGAGDVNADGYADLVIGAPLGAKVYVYHGRPGGLGPSAAWTKTGDAGSQFGAAVGAAGDVNGDGTGDLVVGAPLADPAGGVDAGRAYVFYGAVGGLPGSANWSVDGAAAGNRLGAAVGTAGDADGDGYADVVIGAYGSDGLAGQIQLYQGSSGGLAATPGWTASGEAAADRLGLAVGAAGDVNGDGFSDLIAGAPGYDGGGGGNAGRATVYYGAADGPSRAEDGWKVWGKTGETAGDLNGDGYSDLVVGGCSRLTQDCDTVKASVFYGGPGGLPGAADWSRTGAVGFGRQVGAAGDVNGDGYGELVISDLSSVYVYQGSAAGLGTGGPNWSAAICGGQGCAAGAAGDVNGDGFSDLVVSNKGAGKAWVYYGSPTGLPAAANWTATGWDGYGGAVGTAGDVNGDGYADVVVAGNSTVYVYHGRAAGLTAGAASWSATVEGSSYNPCTASTAGDVNGDGYADVVVGARIADKVYLYLGSAWGLDAPLAPIRGETDGDQFGRSVSTAGDVNGDGYADVLVGAPEADVTGSSSGLAYLYYGSAGGLVAGPEPWAYTHDNMVYMGTQVAGAGDVDGDGFGDLLLTTGVYYSYNPLASVLLRQGNEVGGRVALARQARGDGTRMMVQPWGRSTRDSFDVSLHAVNPLGRGRVRMQVQACPSGVPFGDAAALPRSCQQYTAANWTEIVDAAGVDLNLMAEWLEEDTLYRWRARLLFNSPFQPQGPWRRFQAQSQEADVRAGRLATDLRITKAMLPTEEVPPPAQITYTLIYTAAGGPAAGVVISDILPASLDSVKVFTSGVPIVDTGVEPGYVWWVGDLEAGESGVITITGVANASRFVNIAVIDSVSRDVNPQNNVAMVQTHVDGILYVDADAAGADDGSSWVDAYIDLQDALAAAAPGDQIWVAAGVYKPTGGGDRMATFGLPDGVAIYGGFAGNEAYVYERDWRARPTVLSGDIGTVGNAADNVYHVVVAGGTTVLDGFVITGGQATGEGDDGRGGGIVLGGSALLRQVALLGNTANEGGGIYSTGGSPLLVNAVLSGNAAATGGGVYNAAGSPMLINVTMSENSAGSGGALYDAGGAILANSIVWDEDPMQSLIAGGGASTVTYSDVRGGATGAGNLDADPQFANAKGIDGVAGTLDDDLRLHTTFRFPSPVIDQGDNGALPADADDLDGDNNLAEPLPLDGTARDRIIGFTALPPKVDMGALEANIVDVLAEGDEVLAGGTEFRTQHLQLLSTENLELAALNYSNFNDGEWYYAFCSDYDNLDDEGYCPETGPQHVRNDLLDAVDLYRVAVNIFPTEVFTDVHGAVIPVWQPGGQGVLGAVVEIGNDHLIFGNEYLVDATDYRFSTAGLPYADQILAQELEELGQAARQFELVMDLIFRAFSVWRVGDYCSSDQFETFGVTSSLLMSAMDEMATRHYMKGDSEAAREVYLEAGRNQNMHLTALAELAAETGHAYLTNGSWEMLNNVSRMRERARQIEAGFDFFGFRPDYAPLQPYEQLLELTEGPTGSSGLLGTARDLEDQAATAQRDYDTNASKMSTELDMWQYELDEQLFELCGETEDLDGDGYGDYKTCEGGLMAQNWAEYQAAAVRRALAWNHAQNVARQIQYEQQKTDETIRVILAAGREIAAADLAIGKLEASKTTQTTATGSESEFHTGGETNVEAWIAVGGHASTNPEIGEWYVDFGVRASVSGFFGGTYSKKQSDTTETVWDPAAAQIGAYEGIKDLKEAEKDAIIEGADSAVTIKNLLLEQSEALQEWEVASAELNQVIVEHNHQLETWSRLVNLYAEAVPTILTYNSHLLNPAYRLWRDSLTIQSSAAHSLAAQFAYLTARASEYELLTPFPNLGDAYKTRTANDIRIFLDGLKVWHQALDLPGQLNRYPTTLSLANDFFSLTDEELDPDGLLTAEELAQRRQERLQEELTSRIDNGELEVVFSTSLDQQRPGGHYVFSPNIWNNRIAGIGEPLAGDVGIRVNIVTTEPVDAGVVEVVLVHDGQATYRNAAGEEVIYDPATAVPVGYLAPPELSPAYTTVVMRPDINGEGGLANSGLVNLSVAASHWKLRIPADSWGNLEVGQIKDIQISLDTTGRALPGRSAAAMDDAARLAEGLEMEPPAAEWLRELGARRQKAADLKGESAAAGGLRISAPALAGEVGGSYFGNLVVTSPITIAVYELNFDLVNTEGALTGEIGVTDSSLAAEPIGLKGAAVGDGFILSSDLFTNVVNGRVVSQTFTLTGHAEEEGDVLRATYAGTIINLLPEPIAVQGLFIASRPGRAAGNGLIVEAGTWQLPVDGSTPITITLVNGLLQPIAGTGTISLTTNLGTVPDTVEMVDGVAYATFDAGDTPGEAMVYAAMGGMTGRVHVQIVSPNAPTADAGPDQEVDPGAAVTLDGSGSSDPNGDALTYGWVQTGGEAVTFAPGQSVTTFAAPTSAGALTFTLTVTDAAGLVDSDVTVVTVLNITPTADAGADQQVNFGAAVTLDGSASSDPNGDVLAYGWLQTGGEAVAFTAGVSITTFTAPGSAGPLTFTLTVTDPAGLADSDVTAVTVSNLAPAADAGPDQQADPGAAVTLDGSASSDPTGDNLSYGWVQTGGEAVAFTAGVSVTTFTAPMSAGVLTFTLTVTDSTGLTGVDDTVVTVRNLAPAADAGADQQVGPGAAVTLDGRGSSDPNGDALTYGWLQTGGEAVAFAPDLRLTTFTAPLSAGVLTFTLTVTDPAGLADGDVTVVTVSDVAPTADAGPAQEADPGAAVTLDGSGSSDPNGDALVYGWVQTGGEAVGFTAAVSVTTFTAPVSAGALTFRLTVTDATGLAGSDDTVVTVRNLAPAAAAGPDQQVGPGAAVTLDGRGSSDPNGDALTYGWLQTGGEAVAFTPGVSLTTFTAPDGGGALTFRLTVTDPAGLADGDDTAVTVNNLAPAADAGADQEVDPGAAVTLDGRGSSDPNGDALAYGWVQTGGEAVAFTAGVSVTTFTAPDGAGALTFRLTVTDPGGLADGDDTVVTVNNLAPAADAGPDQQVDPGAAVTLDGRGSADPNGDALAYRWAQTGGEAVGFTAAVSLTTFAAPLSAGVLTFRLTVTDATGLAARDDTAVTVRNLAPAADAGPDQQVNPNAVVVLNGSASSDLNGDALAYGWVQTGGEPVAFTPGLSLTTFTAPDSPGLLTFSLTVTDPAGLADSDVTMVDVITTGMEAETQVAVPIKVAADDAHEVKLSGLVNLGATVLNMTYNNKRIVGLRFQKVPVPQGATITNAYVEFKAQAGDAAAAALTIEGQAADNAPAFTTATWNLSSRARTAAVPWSPVPAWVLNRTYQTPDLAPILQEIVNRPGWAANNALALIVSGTGQRRAYSYNSGAAKAAVLHITYMAPCHRLTTGVDPAGSGTVLANPAPNCGGSYYAAGTVVQLTVQPAAGYSLSNWSGDAAGNANPVSVTMDRDRSVMANLVPGYNLQVAAGSSDAHEVKSTGVVNLGATVLTMTSSNTRIVGLRFQGVPLPQGATVTGAYLEFRGYAADSATTWLTIQGQAVNNAPAFTTATKNISSRPKTMASVVWNAPAWGLNGTYRSPDLSAVVQEIVNRAGWAPNNALVFIVSGTGQRRAFSYNGAPAKAPLLHVAYETVVGAAAAGPHWSVYLPAVLLSGGAIPAPEIEAAVPVTPTVEPMPLETPMPPVITPTVTVTPTVEPPATVEPTAEPAETVPVTGTLAPEAHAPWRDQAAQRGRPGWS